jgi:hypothetical protein
VKPPPTGQDVHVIDWLGDRTPAEIVLLIVGLFIVLAIGAALLTRALVKRGVRPPFLVRRVNRFSEWIVDLVKRPITIAVLDEVADVIQIGHYTKNISAALVENHDELVALVAEKVRNDPSSRVVSRLPGYDAVVAQVSETTLRVLIEMLGDPRMDELVSDMLRNNLEQIKEAVHEREHEEVPPHPPPDRSPMTGRRRRRQSGSAPQS